MGKNRHNFLPTGWKSQTIHVRGKNNLEMAIKLLARSVAEAGVLTHLSDREYHSTRSERRRLKDIKARKRRMALKHGKRPTEPRYKRNRFNLSDLIKEREDRYG